MVALVNRLFRRYRCIVEGKYLAGTTAVDHVGDIVFRRATPSDLDHLDELEPYGRGARQRACVEQEHDLLFVALGQFVALGEFGALDVGVRLDVNVTVILADRGQGGGGVYRIAGEGVVGGVRGELARGEIEALGGVVGVAHGSYNHRMPVPNT